MLRKVAFFTLAATLAAQTEYHRRVETVRRTPGFVALWDFVKRDPADQRFTPHQAKGETHDLRLDAVNYIRDYWNAGRAATYADFPLLGEGPFGQAIRLQNETDPDFRPLLMVPRRRLHDSGIDAKGPGRSVTLVVWLKRESGNHAIAGIWHEGTDHATAAGAAARVEPGQRQYALFAGLAANAGASAAHVSENGARSFGDRYARNLSVTPQTIPEGWAVVGLVFDNRRNTVTSYLNGQADDFWVENLENHPFFKWPARAWQRPPDLPPDQHFRPPETKPRKVERRDGVAIYHYEFTRVRVTPQPNGEPKRELIALRANPFWFPHDLYAPNAQSGGPFTIGRVIHMSRGVGLTGAIGGVAVFDRALTKSQMARLAAVAKPGPIRLPADR